MLGNLEDTRRSATFPRAELGRKRRGSPEGARPARCAGAAAGSHRAPETLCQVPELLSVRNCWNPGRGRC